MISLKLILNNNKENIIKINLDDSNLSGQINKINEKYQIEDKEKFKKELLKKLSYQQLIHKSKKNIFNNKNIKKNIEIEKSYTDISKISNKKKDKSFTLENIEDKEFFKMENKFDRNFIKEDDLKKTYENLFKKVKNNNNKNNNSIISQKASKISTNKKQLTENYLNKNFERLYHDKAIKDNKKNILEKKRIRNELKECTFSPKISKRQRNHSNISVFDKLYTNAKQKKISQNTIKTSNSNLSSKKFNHNKFKQYQINKDNKKSMISYLKDNYDMNTGQRYFNPKITKYNKENFNKINLKKIATREKAKKLDSILENFFNIISINNKYIDINKIDINNFNDRFVICFEAIFILLIRENKKLNFEQFCDLIINNNLIGLFVKYNSKNKDNNVSVRNKEEILYKSFSYKISELIKN